MKTYRKATIEDLDAIVEIYQHTHDAEEAGLTTIGWKREIYPTRETALAAFERDDMYVCEVDGKVVASALINKLQVDVYADAPWQFEAPDDKVLVIHTLCMEPTIKHQGIGRGFIEYYENLAREMGCEVLRLDTNYTNKVAQKFYKSLGYRYVDTIPTVFNGIPGIKLVLLEKKVQLANVDASQMSKAEIHAKIQKGYDSYKDGRVMNAAEAFEEFKKENF